MERSTTGEGVMVLTLDMLIDGAANRALRRLCRGAARPAAPARPKRPARPVRTRSAA